MAPDFITPIKHTHAHTHSRHLCATPECLARVVYFIFLQRRRGMKESLCFEQLGPFGLGEFMKTGVNWPLRHQSERPVNLAVATATHTHTKHTDSHLYVSPSQSMLPRPSRDEHLSGFAPSAFSARLGDIPGNVTAPLPGS